MTRKKAKTSPVPQELDLVEIDAAVGGKSRGSAQQSNGWSTSGDADDRPTEEVAFYYNKVAR